jgi:prepilin-type N-terminal cleavage/methylation domain-containing protein
VKLLKSHGSQAGYSLIELMVGLIITSLMLGASIPAMSRYLRDHQLLGYVENIAADLRLCRQRATTQGNNFVFSYDPDDKTYTILDDQNNNGSADSGEGTIGPKEMPDGITLENDSGNPFTSMTITFLPSGAADQGGQVNISDDNGLSRSVMLIRVSGMVKII